MHVTNPAVFAAGAAPATSLFPPPPTPPPSALGAVNSASALPAQQLYAPPPGPPPSGSTNTPVFATGPVSGSVAHSNASSALMLELAADSTSLLPGTVAVLDCGDHIIIRRNCPKSEDSTSDSTAHSSGAHADDLVSRVESEAQAMASLRYPVPSVFVLNKPGTPQDRMLYCRLSPTHMDAKEIILTQLTAELQCHTQHNVTHGASQQAGYHRAVQDLLRGLTPQAVDAMLVHAPFTDQLFFAKYLTQVVPSQAAALLTKSAPAAEEARKAVPVSQSMDRGPVSVFAPPAVPPTSNRGGLFGYSTSTDSGLPL